MGATTVGDTKLDTGVMVEATEEAMEEVGPEATEAVGAEAKEVVGAEATGAGTVPGTMPKGTMAEAADINILEVKTSIRHSERKKPTEREKLSERLPGLLTIKVRDTTPTEGTINRADTVKEVIKVVTVGELRSNNVNYVHSLSKERDSA